MFYDKEAVFYLNPEDLGLKKDKTVYFSLLFQNSNLHFFFIAKYLRQRFLFGNSDSQTQETVQNLSTGNINRQQPPFFKSTCRLNIQLLLLG